MRLHHTFAFTVSLLSGLCLSSATAQPTDYPTRTITMVVGYSAGGGTDVLARIVAEKLAASLGQAVVV